MNGLFDYPKPTAAELAKYAKRPTLRLTRYDRSIVQAVERLLKQSDGLSVEEVREQIGISNTLRARACLSHLEAEGKVLQQHSLWFAQKERQ